MRVEEAFAAAGINREGEPILDSHILAECPKCPHSALLSEMKTKDSGEQTNYKCPKCDAVVVRVGPAPGLTGGYRLGDNVVDAIGGMAILPPEEKT